MSMTNRQNVYFIDQGVSNYESIIKDLPANAEALILTTESSALEQMAAFLDNRSGINSISIISHGDEGQLALAGEVLTKSDLESNAQTLALIGNALSEDGDILLYGCNVGTGESGLEFVETLAQLTGADVAASDDLTGAVALGGDWDLEVATNTIEAPMLNAESFSGILASNSETLIFGADDASGNRNLWGYNPDTGRVAPVALPNAESTGGPPRYDIYDLNGKMVSSYITEDDIPQIGFFNGTEIEFLG